MISSSFIYVAFSFGQSNILDLTLDAALSNLIQRTPSLRSLSIAGTYPNLRVRLSFFGPFLVLIMRQLNVIPIVTALSSPECGLTSLNISDNVTIDDLSAHISNLLVVTANLRELNIAGPLQSTASIAQILLGWAYFLHLRVHPESVFSGFVRIVRC